MPSGGGYEMEQEWEDLTNELIQALEAEGITEAEALVVVGIDTQTRAAHDAQLRSFGWRARPFGRRVLRASRGIAGTRSEIGDQQPTTLLLERLPLGVLRLSQPAAGSSGN